jgi:hypothetical protein
MRGTFAVGDEDTPRDLGVDENLESKPETV